MKQHNSSQSKNSSGKSAGSDWKEQFEEDFGALLAVADRQLGRDERHRLMTCIQSFIVEAEKRGYHSHAIWKEIRAGEYEPPERKGAREAISKILSDLCSGIDATEGDMKEAEAKGKNLDFFHGYFRALHFAVQHVLEIGEKMGITGLEIQ